jgi:hypothetical protein
MNRLFCVPLLLVAVAIPASADAQAQRDVLIRAGLRGYPQDVAAALAVLADHPAWLERQEKRLRDNQPLDLSDSAMPLAVRDALSRLERAPEALLIAADHPQALAALRGGSPAEAQRLHAAYEHMRRAGMSEWRDMIRENREAFDAYRELWTQICREQLRSQPDFACIAVTDPDYYFAVVPDEGLMQIASTGNTPAALCTVLDRWWSVHSPARADERVITGSLDERRFGNEQASIIDMSGTSRARMWRAAPRGEMGEALGLVPVIAQPFEDQPDDARLAVAIALHARTWSSLEAPRAVAAAQDEAEDFDDEASASFADAPPPDAQAFDPATQSVRLDEIDPQGHDVVIRDIGADDDAEVLEEIYDDGLEIAAEPQIIAPAYYGPAYVPTYPVYYPSYSTFSFGAYFGGASRCRPYWPSYYSYCGPRYYSSCHRPYSRYSYGSTTYVGRSPSVIRFGDRDRSARVGRSLGDIRGDSGPRVIRRSDATRGAGTAGTVIRRDGSGRSSPRTLGPSSISPRTTRTLGSSNRGLRSLGAPSAPRSVQRSALGGSSNSVRRSAPSSAGPRSSPGGRSSGSPSRGSSGRSVVPRNPR